MALELMGKTGLRQDNGAEKILRDAKLLQIYEGTNQLNRIKLMLSTAQKNLKEQEKSKEEMPA